MIWFSTEFLAAWGGKKLTMEAIFDVKGDIYREPPGANRRTLRFERGGQGFFLKLHCGVGWREIIKNLGSLRLPVLGASNEWRAIRRLEQVGVETMCLAGFGRAGVSLARQRSFVITEELADCISLEDYCRDWLESPPPFAVKMNLIRRIAEVARRLHKNGINHRDFYICHFLLQAGWDAKVESLHLYLIDLHRVQIRGHTPMRWVVKDIGSLWFSAMQIGLTQRDLLRFIRVYRDLPLRQTLSDDAAFWDEVGARAMALDATRPPPKSEGAVV